MVLPEGNGELVLVGCDGTYNLLMRGAPESSVRTAGKGQVLGVVGSRQRDAPDPIPTDGGAGVKGQARWSADGSAFDPAESAFIPC